jgi:hypothetical protein
MSIRASVHTPACSYICTGNHDSNVTDLREFWYMVFLEHCILSAFSYSRAKIRDIYVKAYIYSRYLTVFGLYNWGSFLCSVAADTEKGVTDIITTNLPAIKRRRRKRFNHDQ